MAHSLSLLRDLEQALCESGRDALTGAAPFGAVLGAVARTALELSGDDLSAADIRAGLQELANAEQAAYIEMLDRTLAEVPDAHADCRGAVRRYLEHWPALIRHALRRPSNPAGRVVPAGMAFESPAELLRFLPTGCPRLRPGPVPGVPEWELTRYCGVGDGTEVWGARSTTGAEPAALKFITDPAAARRVFDSESLFTRVFSLTGQSGIVPLRTVYPGPNRVCIEAGYAPGYDLAGVMFDWKWRWGRPMPDPAAGLARRLADVVGKAHARQIVHRNLKPSNVILMPAEGARFALWVSDFGWGQIAAALRVRAEVARETPQALRGAHTPLYLAPQVAAGHPADPRDDVYAIGLIWYQLLRQDAAADPARAPGWADELTADGVPEAHVELLAACLAPAAAARPADAGALAQRLGTLPTAPSPHSTARAPATAPAPAPAPAAAPASGITAKEKTVRARPAPDDPLSSVGSSLNGPTSGVLSGVSIFDSRAPGSGDSGPVSGRYTRPPGPVTTSLPANVALGRGRSAGMALNSIGMTFARIPAGVFMMGADRDDDHRFVGDELPQHFVRINRPFFMSVFQVTQAEFERVTGRNPSYFNKDRKGGPSHPVESVSWFEAEQFCAQLSALPAEVTAARRYALPTEAEWEYACRAGTRTAFWCGARLTTDVANFTTGREKHNVVASGGTQPVGQYRPNVWGLYDTHGNVEEWVRDWFDDKYYSNTPVDDPTGPETGSARVTRGGCWQSFATECRSAARSASPPERGLSRIGFRVIMLEKER